MIKWFAAAALFVSTASPAAAHRLDEYLQAALITVERNRVELQVRLSPGVAVLPAVLAGIDTNADGVIAESEQQAYTARVLGDLSLTVDDVRLKPRVVSTSFPAIQEMKEGLGQIRLEFSADLPVNGPKRRLIFENGHRARISAYLVNCLVPRDPDIRFLAQNRNDSQSRYELLYMQAGVAWWSGSGLWIGAAALVLVGRLAILQRRSK
jgi:hypothetical protein